MFPGAEAGRVYTSSWMLCVPSIVMFAFKGQASTLLQKIIISSAPFASHTCSHNLFLPTLSYPLFFTLGILSLAPFSYQFSTCQSNNLPFYSSLPILNKGLLKAISPYQRAWPDWPCTLTRSTSQIHRRPAESQR